MNDESPLVAPAYRGGPSADAGHEAVAANLADAIQRETGLTRVSALQPSWLGLECDSVRAAVWMMRMMVAVNVLSRREGTALFVPVNPAVDADGEIVSSSVALVHRLAVGRGVAGA